ncbi:sensor histidine kinase KdpD [Luteolibacter flavescens]|uniref:histidine kinase n=1 Tax=Luteolibacter flavescens TaxID=1859460 RepID=A0ABT3FLE6_9BACT|nr:sensor histidine kinase KdpD [Luteolibacter flavescens]MCW1884394.1 sensor histidine kinase KdpD [Luteolibacter flavescens]
MTHDRPDPDLLLAQVQREEGRRRPGRLFIFLGMCPGVGKTYAMLQTARQRRNDGLRVLVGVVETHGRVETAALLDGLEILPRRKIEHGGHLLEEFDLDAALTRRPDFLLVDELAHTNATGSRHAKRYQDVLELLDAGIDVCTTLNVQHIESQVDVVRQVTGVAVQETVPDSLLDRAHEIQLVDLSVEKLLQRMSEGRVYLGERADAAAEGFFREGNLTALRELALRFTAEKVDRDLEDFRRARRDATPWKTNARLLVGVAPTPYSESLVRWTRRAAARIGCPWIGVWVEGSRMLRPDEEELLSRGLALVRRLGGEVVHVTGDDVAKALLDVAQERNVSQIVVGKSDHRRFRRTTLTDRIIAGSGDIDVCVVRPLAGKRAKPPQEAVPASRWREYGSALLLTTAVTLLSMLLLPYSGYMVPSFIYLLAIVLGSMKWERGPMLLMAGASAFAWDCLFIPPRFTFHVNEPEDMAMLAMFFVVALAMGQLTTRLKMRERAERERQLHTDALLRVTQQAALHPQPDKGLEAALRIIESILGGQIALLLRQDDHSLGRNAHQASAFAPDDAEFAVAAWSFANHQLAGRFTDTLPAAAATWFPLQTATSTMGVLGLNREAKQFTFTERQATEAFALQLALILEKEHFIVAVQHAEKLEEGEKLRRALLDSVSHELKTPIAVIRAAVDASDSGNDPYLAEIDTASRRLQRIVEGLLQMTRLESSVIEPRIEWCDATDIVSAALESTGDIFRERAFTSRIVPDLPLVKTDHSLMEQVLANVLHNAAVHTSPDTPVELMIRRHPGGIEFVVRDHGKGIPQGEEKKIFGKFHRAPGAPAGGTGLGLSIAKGFLRALGGEIFARNHHGGGAEFTIRLNAETMEPATVAEA